MTLIIYMESDGSSNYKELDKDKRHQLTERQRQIAAAAYFAEHAAQEAKLLLYQGDQWEDITDEDLAKLEQAEQRLQSALAKALSGNKKSADHLPPIKLDPRQTKSEGSEIKTMPQPRRAETVGVPPKAPIAPKFAPKSNNGKPTISRASGVKASISASTSASSAATSSTGFLPSISPTRIELSPPPLNSKQHRPNSVLVPQKMQPPAPEKSFLPPIKSASPEPVSQDKSFFDRMYGFVTGLKTANLSNLPQKSISNQGVSFSSKVQDYEANGYKKFANGISEDGTKFVVVEQFQNNERERFVIKEKNGVINFYDKNGEAPGGLTSTNIERFFFLALNLDRGTLGQNLMKSFPDIKVDQRVVTPSSTVERVTQGLARQLSAKKNEENVLLGAH